MGSVESEPLTTPEKSLNLSCFECIDFLILDLCFSVHACLFHLARQVSL